MATILFISLTALLVCFLVAYLAKKLDFVDLPDGVRKTHIGRVPLGGGIAISLAILI